MNLKFPAWLIFLWLTTASADSSLGNTPHPLADQVVVVANRNIPDSMLLARYYAENRGIPENNLVFLDAEDTEKISRATFVDTIWNPLRKTLLDRGLINGELSETRDNEGRFLFYPLDTHFRYMVLCKGLPLKVRHQVILNPEEFINTTAIFRTIRCSLDSELALIVARNRSMVGWIPNPLFQVHQPSAIDSTTAVAVTRLDGPSYELAKQLVDRAIEADNQAIVPGRVYIDLHPHHPDGNDWLTKAAGLLKDYGYEVDIETSAAHWSKSDRYDAPAVYLGWYRSHASAPPAGDLQALPPGAIGLHIHSLSAATLNDTSKHWVGPLVASGFTATAGNVSEPYLQFTLRPDLWMLALLRGQNLGSASLFANPVLSWQHVTIGDPLLIPFGGLNSEQALELMKCLELRDPYLILFAFRILAAKDLPWAVELLVNRFVARPHVVIAHSLLTAYFEEIDAAIQTGIVDFLFTQQDIPAYLAYLYLDILSLLKDKANHRADQLQFLLAKASRQWSEDAKKALSPRLLHLSVEHL